MGVMKPNPESFFGKKRRKKKRRKKSQKQVKAFHCSQELMLSFCYFEHKGLVFRFSNHIIFLAGFEQTGSKTTHFSKKKTCIKNKIKVRESMLISVFTAHPQYSDIPTD